MVFQAAPAGFNLWGASFLLAWPAIALLAAAELFEHTRNGDDWDSVNVGVSAALV